MTNPVGIGLRDAVTHSHRISVTLQPIDRRTGQQQRISDREEAFPPRPHRG